MRCWVWLSPEIELASPVVPVFVQVTVSPVFIVSVSGEKLPPDAISILYVAAETLSLPNRITEYKTNTKTKIFMMRPDTDITLCMAGKIDILS